MPNDHDDVDTYRFCPECGAQAAERAKFCGECGRSLIKEAAAQSTAQSIDQLPLPPMTTDLPTVEEPSQAPAVSTSVVDPPTDGADQEHAADTEPSAEQQEAAPLVVPPMTTDVPTVEDPGQAPAVSMSVVDTPTDATGQELATQSDPWTVPFTGPDPSAEQQETETAALVPDLPAPVGVPPRGRHHRGVWSPDRNDEMSETVAQPAAPPIPYFDPPPTSSPPVYVTPWEGGAEENGSLPSAPRHVSFLSEVLPPPEPMLITPGTLPSTRPDEVRPDADEVAASNSERAYTSPAFVIPMVVVAAIVIIVIFISSR